MSQHPKPLMHIPEPYRKQVLPVIYAIFRANPLVCAVSLRLVNPDATEFWAQWEGTGHRGLRTVPICSWRADRSLCVVREGVKTLSDIPQGLRGRPR